jgi:hypothetical protein
MIGSWGRAVIGWALNNPGIVSTFFAVWLALFATSNWQLNRIKSKTHKLVLKEAEKILEQKPNINIKDFYESLHPIWRGMVKDSALFIPHRWELWPMPATPNRVQKRIDFTPEWLGEFLWMEEVKMNGVKPPEKPPEDDPLTKLKKMGRN